MEAKERLEEPQDELEALRQEQIESTGTDTQTVVFEEGFTLKTVIGVLFVAFVMLPGALYLGLVSGQSIGSAAEWVTIVLFAEVARRSFIPLKRQEIYVLFYVAASLTGLSGELGVSGGPFGWLIWNGYLHIAPQATGTTITLPDPVTGEMITTTVSRAVPTWVVPPEDSQVWVRRTFFDAAWLLPIGLLLIGEVVGRIGWITGGYTLFRITSDIERLPFPMAPVSAAGATALAEAGTKEESWRWRVFSIGAMMGLIFGFFYLGIPIFTGAILPQPLMLIKLPFIDLTANTEGILPGAAVSISGDLTHVLVGFVLPYAVVLGTFLSGIITQLILNPILQRSGFLPTWRPGANAIYTQFATNLDLWLSVNIGVNIAIAIIGIGMAVVILRQYLRNRGRDAAGRQAFTPPPGRGDFSWQLAIGAFFLCQAVYVGLGHWLVPKFPLLVLIFFGFVYTPAMSYVSARLYGLAGRPVGMPYLREAVFIKSGYKGIDIWFAPFPQHDYGWAAQRFREVELTGTKFTSIVKAEAFMLPVVLIASFVFWAFFWYTSAIPSSQFPYAQMFWPLNVTYRVLWMSATTGGSAALDQFLGAIRGEVIIPSMVAGLLGYWVTTAAKLPVLFYYGLVGGLGGFVHGSIPMMIGALLSRHYFSKRFGEHEWHRYAPVLLAGFSCGMGLIAMVAIALGLITKSVSFLPF
jgi:hypothetical protein